MAVPTVKVEIAWTSGFSTPAASRTWTDVSAYFDGTDGYSITYGRGPEQGAVTPTSITLTLNNKDGRFTPELTSGAYYPNVKKGRPIRISVDYGGGSGLSVTDSGDGTAVVTPGTDSGDGSASVTGGADMGDGTADLGTGSSSVRFTGYVDDWPLSWPTGSDLAAQVQITATSRRARISRTATLSSAIRSAYLAKNLDYYWPLDETNETTDAAGRQVFRDVTNNGYRENLEALGVFYSTNELRPRKVASNPGPTDEAGLVLFPASSDIAALGTFSNYVGAGNAVRIDPAGGVTIMAAARCEFTPGLGLVNVFQLRTADLKQAIIVSLSVDVFFEMMFRDPDTGVVLDDQTSFAAVTGPTERFIAATDGQIHHYALTLTGGTTGEFFFDGVSQGTLTLAGSYQYTRPFTALVISDDALTTDAGIGHVGIAKRVLTNAEIADCARAATAASEGIAARVTRLADYVGIPAAEVSVETSIAPALGPQPEAGRGVSELLDQIATSTGGVAYDGRDGTLQLQARNHRYNAATAFTLSTTDAEIEPDLQPILDDSQLVNEVTWHRAGSQRTPATASDQTSIDDYGIYHDDVEVVTSSENEAEAAALNRIARRAQPRVTIRQVSVDIGDLASSQRALVLAADIGTKFALAGLPNQAPTSTLTQFLEGYTESLNTTAHVMTFNTSPGSFDSVWQLGDATLGVLGSTTISAY